MTLAGHPIAASLVAAVLWAVYLVATRIIFTGTRVDPFGYALIQMLAGGLFMIALAGRSRVAWASLLNLWTAMYGGLRTVVIASTALALVYLPAAQASLLGAFNVPLAAAADWYFKRKRPPWIEYLGNGLLLAAALLIVAALPGGRIWIGIFWQVLSESSAVASGVIAWRHPANQGDSIGERARTTGVLLVAAALATAVGWWLMGLGGFASQPLAAGGALTDGSLWLYGVAAGVLVRGPGTYISLYVYRYGGLHTHMAGLAGIPLAVIVLEQICIRLGWLKPVSFGVPEIAAMLMVLAGAVILLRAKTRPSA